jgi:hypothetical protein
MEVASWKPADLLSFVPLVSSLPRAIQGGWKWQCHDAASLVVLTVAPLGSYTIDRFAENAVRFTIGVGAWPGEPLAGGFLMNNPRIATPPSQFVTMRIRSTAYEIGSAADDEASLSIDARRIG